MWLLTPFKMKLVCLECLVFSLLVFVCTSCIVFNSMSQFTSLLIAKFFCLSLYVSLFILYINLYCYVLILVYLYLLLCIYTLSLSIYSLSPCCAVCCLTLCLYLSENSFFINIFICVAAFLISLFGESVLLSMYQYCLPFCVSLLQYIFNLSE